MSTYNHDVPNIDIANRISKLTIRINQDPQIIANLVTITYSDPILSISFDVSLSDNELYIIGVMVKSIFLGAISGETFEYNNIVRIPRNLDKVTYTPLVTDDINSGYNSGSTIYDQSTPALYTCLDNTENNAVWVRCDNAYTNVCTAGSTITSGISSSLTTINPTTIIFSTPNTWTFDGSGRLTVNVTGTYRISYTIQITATLLTNVSAYLVVNGASLSGSVRSIGIATGIGTINNNVTYANLTANDKIQIAVQASTILASFSVTTINSVTNYSILLSLEQV